MASNKTLELSIKIAGKVDKSLIRAINDAQSNVSSLSTTLSKVGTAGLAAMGTMATGTVVTLAKCTDAAKDFESQMSDVVKYVDGLADADGLISDKLASNGVTYAENYAVVSGAIKDLSTQIPMTAEELTQLAAAAGQSGKGIGDLVKLDSDGNIGGFLKDAAMMGTAMDISAEQAGDWAAKWEHSFKMTHAQVMVLSDQINYLGANNATTAAEIAQVVNDSAALGQIAGMSADSTAALATAMLAMGVDGSKAATSISRVYTNLSLGASATKAQKGMWKSLGFTAEGVAKSMQVDATGTMIDVFEAIGNMDADKQVAALKTLFGQWAIQGAAKLSGNLGAFTDALAMVNDPSLYSKSMEREFIIKASNSEAIDMMTSNAFQALKIDVGTSFLPAKKDVSTALIGFVNQLRNMPELGKIAEQLAALFSKGIEWAGESLEKALPYIERALDYLLDNGPQVVSVLKTLAGTFLAMKFAPGAEKLVRGVGGLVFGSRTGGKDHTGSGGIAGLVGNLFRGGQKAAGTAAAMPGNAGTWLRNFIGATKETMATTGRTGVGGFLRTAAGATIGQTGVGRYLGGIGSSIGNFFNKSGIAGVTRGTLSVTGEILSNISQATGLTDLVKGGIGLARTGAGKVAGGVTTLASNVANSAPIQAVTGFAGKVINSAPVQGIASMVSGAAGWLGNTVTAGAGLVGSAWEPMASGFGSLLSGALPVVGAISGIIAVLSLMWDNVDMLRGPIEAVFGEKGLAVFDSFKNGLNGVFSFVQKIFDGGLADAVLPFRNAFEGMLEGGGFLSTIFGGTEGGLAAFDGVVAILQSVLSVVGQVVTFANTTVKPIIQEIFRFITQTVMPVILQTFSSAAPVISGIISNLGSAIMTVAQIIGTAIQAVLPIVEGLITVVLNIGQEVIPAVLEYIEQFSAGIMEIVSAVQTIFQGVIDFVTGVFTGDWEKAWQAVLDIFGGIFNGLVALIKTPMNAVISIINGAIRGINNISVDVPDWGIFGDLAGKKLGFSISEIPMLAKGGFTNGPSIAGEAGTEAVISFQRNARASNIATWEKAGQMLGVYNKPARLETFDMNDSRPGWPNGSGSRTVTITYSPTIIIQGNADRDMIDAALRDDKARFDAWYEKKRRDERRTRW